MKKLITFLLLLLSSNIIAQSFFIFDVETKNYPRNKASFVMFDEQGRQVYDLSEKEVSILENGNLGTNILVVNPKKKTPEPVSVVLAIDVSGSMFGENIEKAKAAAKQFIQLMSFDVSECALTTFDSYSNLICDFTNRPEKLLAEIDKIEASGGTDYNDGFMSESAGALKIAKNANNMPYVLFLTDGLCGGDETAIINMAKGSNITVFTLTLGFKTPDILKNISTKTNGKHFEIIDKNDNLSKTYGLLANIIQKVEKGAIFWNNFSCDKNITSTITARGLSKYFSYPIPKDLTSNLHFEPSFMRINKIDIGQTIDTTFLVQTKVRPIIIKDINLDVQGFYKLEKPDLPMEIHPGDSILLPVRFTQMDSTLRYSQIIISTNQCNGQRISLSSGMKTDTSLVVVYPNGGEEFPIISDAEIKWDGIPSKDFVTLAYRNGENKFWKIIGNTCCLKSKWITPPVPGNEYKVRASKVLNTNTQSLIRTDKKCIFNNDVTLGAILNDTSTSIIELESNRFVANLPAPGANAKKVCFSKIHNHIFFQWNDSITCYDIDSKKKLYTLNPYGEKFKLDFSPYEGKGPFLHITEKEIIIIDKNTQQEVFSINKPKKCKVFFFEQQSMLFIASEEKITIYDLTKNGKPEKFKEHAYNVTGLYLLPNTNLVISKDAKGYFMVWDYMSLKKKTRSRATDVYFNQDSTTLLMVSRNSVKVVDAETGKRVSSCSSSDYGGFSLSKDNKIIKIKTKQDEIKFWDITNNKWISSTFGENYQYEFNDFNLSPDNKKIVTANNNYYAYVWDAENGEMLNGLNHNAVVQSAKFSFSGKSVFTIYKIFDMSKDILRPKISLINLKSGKTLDTKWGHTLSKVFTDNLENLIFREKTLASKRNIFFLPHRKAFINSEGNLINIFTNKVIKEIQGTGNYYNFNKQGTKAVCWSLEDSLFGELKNKQIEFIDLENNIIEKTVEMDYDKLYFGPNLNKMVVEYQNGLKVIDTKTEIILADLGYESDDESVSVKILENVVHILKNKSKKILIEHINEGLLLQDDVSDNNFSINASLPEASDIEFSEVVIGFSEEKYIKKYIKNLGKWPAYIENIAIIDDPNDQFVIVSGASQIDLMPKEFHDIEVRFNPQVIGEIKAKLQIISSSDTLIYSVSGTGVKNPIKILDSDVFVGKVKLKESLMKEFAVVKNVSQKQIVISGIALQDKITKVFTINDANKKITLKPDEVVRLKIKFKPDQMGRITKKAIFNVEGFTPQYQFNISGIGDAHRKVTIIGKVIERNTNMAVGKAMVKCFDLFYNRTVLSKETHKDGKFTMVANVDRNYGIIAEKENYISGSVNIDLSGNDNKSPVFCTIYVSKLKKGSLISSGNIFFDTNKANLTENSTSELERICKLFDEHPKLELEVTGHTDNKGLPNNNLILSDRRSEAVMQYLIKKGIPQSKLTSKGYGDTKPVADNTTKEGRKLNRRVEFVIKNI